MSRLENKSLNRDRILMLQLLRGLAALMVVFGHSQEELLQAVSGTGLIDFKFGIGVDIFFVISGFIMVYTSKQYFGKFDLVRKFLIKRIIRIVPIYWMFTTLMVIATLVVPTLLETAKFDIVNVICSYLFIPYHTGDKFRPILALGWTLNYEMFFYFIFSISLIFNKNISVILTSVVLLIFALIGFYIKDDLSLLKFWTDNIIIEFGYGLVIGYLYLKFGSFTSRFFIPLLLLSLLILFTMPQLNLYRFISSGVPAALLVTVFVFFTSDFKGQIVEQTALMLGDSSYSLYLCHLFVLAIVKIIFPFSHNFPSFNWLYVIVSTVLSVICSIVIYQFIEKNTINYLNNMLCKWYV